MVGSVEFDETDLKIINMLICDARVRLKDIAEECQSTSVSILNRIKRLEASGIICGSTIIPKNANIGLPICATVGITLEGKNVDEVLDVLREDTRFIESSLSIGEYDICALIFAKNISELDQIAFSIKERFSAKITISVWSGEPQLVFKNIDLQPLTRTP